MNFIYLITLVYTSTFLINLRWPADKCIRLIKILLPSISVGYRYLSQILILFEPGFDTKFSIDTFWYLVPIPISGILTSILFDTFKIFDIRTGNFCRAKYYFSIKINKDSSMDLKNEFSDFLQKISEEKMRYRKLILVLILFDTLFWNLFQVPILFDPFFRYLVQESIIIFDTSSWYLF